MLADMLDCKSAVCTVVLLECGITVVLHFVPRFASGRIANKDDDDDDVS